MAKYNISAPKEKVAAYKLQIGAALTDELEKKIFDTIRVKEKYKDRHYTAAKLAQELGTNTRYISAVMGIRFGMSYTMYVNTFRIEKVMQMMRDKRYVNYTMEDFCHAVGFSNRQTFYAAFFKIKHMTPGEFKERYGAEAVRKNKELK